jgi:hypothetical protein
MNEGTRNEERMNEGTNVYLSKTKYIKYNIL